MHESLSRMWLPSVMCRGLPFTRRGSMYKDVVECLQHIPEVVECHFTTGPYTMMVKLYARDNEQLMHLLNGRLQDIPGVVATETLISLEQSIKREIPVTFDE